MVPSVATEKIPSDTIGDRSRDPRPVKILDITYVSEVCVCPLFRDLSSYTDPDETDNSS
jgi:hypothetical protein